MKALEVFQDTNPAWSKTLSFMTDKDFVERDVIRTLFPSVSLLICRYHTLRTFRRELTTEKMSISAAQRDICLSIVSDIVYATNEDSYEQQRQRLLNLNLAKVTEYFSAWHDIRHEWVEGLSRLHMTLGETTNNRLESLNGKIKSVCSRYATLQQFFSELRMVLKTLRNERIHKALMLTCKRPTIAVHDDLSAYRERLTPYAFDKVTHQHALSLKVSPIDSSTPEEAVFASTSGLVKTTASQCTCWNFSAIQLVCKHILCYRRLHNLPTSVEDVCSTRWLKNGYLQHCNLKLAATGMSPSVQLSMDVVEQRTASSVLSQAEKYRKAKGICSTLATLCSEPGMATYRERVDVLKKYWICGRTMKGFV